MYSYYIASIDELETIWSYGICDPRQLDLFDIVNPNERRILLHPAPAIARQHIVRQFHELTPLEQENQLENYVLVTIDKTYVKEPRIVFSNHSFYQQDPIPVEAIVKVEPICGCWDHYHRLSAQIN